MTLRKCRGSALARQRFGDSGLDPRRASERLVGIGFRCWLAGYDTCDIACWETGWNHYARELGPTQAKTAVTELACWVRAVREGACRKIDYLPHGCMGFGRDECIAISMVAASQHSACPAMRACAFALLGASDIDNVVESAASFGSVLAVTGHVLSDQSICDATMLDAINTPGGSTALQ